MGTPALLKRIARSKFTRSGYRVCIDRGRGDEWKNYQGEIFPGLKPGERVIIEFAHNHYGDEEISEMTLATPQAAPGGPLGPPPVTRPPPAPAAIPAVSDGVLRAFLALAPAYVRGRAPQTQAELIECTRDAALAARQALRALSASALDSVRDTLTQPPEDHPHGK